MTTIHTIQDLFHLLAAHPEYREEARRYVLNDDLLNLPALFASFAAEQRQFNDEQRQFNDEQRRINEEQRQFNDEQRRVNEEQRQFNDEQRRVNEEQRQFNDEQRDHNARFDRFIEEQHQFNDEQRAHNARFDRFIEEQHQFNDEQRQFNDEQRSVNNRFDSFIEEQRRTNRELRRDIGEIRSDMSQLRGAHARNETRRRVNTVARRMGLRWVRTLTDDDLECMTENADTSDILTREIDSFVDADLVIETTDANRQSVYVAMEISYTANRRDTGRAIRNADFLARFTGQSARPAIASVRNDPEIADAIASGQVHWHEISEQDLDPKIANRGGFETRPYALCSGRRLVPEPGVKPPRRRVNQQVGPVAPAP